MMLSALAIAAVSTLPSEPQRVVSFRELAARCAPDIHINTLLRVVRHESGFNAFAIGINSKAYVKPKSPPRTLAQALTLAEELKLRKIDFDIGLGQINVRNLKSLNLTLEETFDPCTNLKAAQTILAGCYGRALKVFPAGQRALLAALSCYNTGTFSRGFANGYVSKVARIRSIKVPELQEPIEVKEAPQAGRNELRNQSPVDAESAERKAASGVDQNGSGDAFKGGTKDVFDRPPGAKFF